MKKTFKRLQTLNRLILDCEREIETASALPFYSLFGQEAQQESDLEALQLRLAELMATKGELLSRLQDKIKLALKRMGFTTPQP